MNFENENRSPERSENLSPSFYEFYLSVRKWVIHLLKRWIIIAPIVIISGLLGITYSIFTKAKYESRLTFALEESGGGGLSGALNLAAEFGLNLGSSSSIFSGDNILQIITSRRVIENVLLSFDSTSKNKRTIAQYLLDIKRSSNDNKKPSRIDSINFPANKNRKSFSYLEDSVLYILYEQDILNNLIAQRPDKKLGTFEIKFTSTDEEFSKIFTERLMQETIEFYTELRSGKSRQTLEILENRVAMLRGDVNSTITSRSKYQDANLNPAFAESQAPLQQKQVDLTAYSGAYAELFKNLELARYQFLQDVPLLQIIDDVKYPLKRLKKGKLFMGILFSMISGILSISILSIVYLLKHNK